MTETDLLQAWDRGLFTQLIYHDGQKALEQVYKNTPRMPTVFNVSRQYGKSVFGVCEALKICFMKPKAKVKIAAAFEVNLTEFILPSFDFVLDHPTFACPTYARPVYKESKRKWVFKNGSEIKLIGLDKNRNGLRGNQIDLMVLDEAGFISRLHYLYTSVIVPLTTHRPNAKILIQSTPPESPDHEFWDLVDSSKEIGSYAEFTIDQNPLLTDADRARIEKDMGGRHTTAFRREYLCERIIEEEKAIIPQFRKDLHVREFICDSPYHHRYEGLDIGIKRDKTVCLFGHYNFAQATLYIENEVDIPNITTTTKLIHDSIRFKEAGMEWEPNSVYRRISDNSHPLLINDLAADPYKLYFTATDKDKLHEMVNKVKVWFQNNRIIVHPRCKQLIGCLSSGIWDKNRTTFEESKTYGHFDALAALIYLVRNIDENTDPIPVQLTQDQIMPYRKPVMPEMANDLAAAFNIRK